MNRTNLLTTYSMRFLSFRSWNTLPVFLFAANHLNPIAWSFKLFHLIEFLFSVLHHFNKIFDLCFSYSHFSEANYSNGKYHHNGILEFEKFCFLEDTHPLMEIHSLLKFNEFRSEVIQRSLFWKISYLLNSDEKCW